MKRMRYGVLAVIWLASGARGLTAQEAFTIEQVLSAPFPTSLVAAKSGAVAWVFNARGVRNIWVADPPGYQARQLTGYSADDGQELSSLQFTPDGGAIVYVRGGGPNGRGELPNPTSDPGGVERAIWLAPVSGGPPRKLANGAGPALAPGSREVAYLSGGVVMTVGLDSGSTPKAIISARGGQGSLRWSPDGSKLAFVSNRGLHAFVGVYDFASKAIRWMDPGVDQDVEPVWSPDGRQLAFGRMATDVTPRLFVAERAGEPWSIRVADVATGTAREVFRATPGRGSVYREIVGERQLYWTSDGHLVFPWERDGWTHLYAVPAAGGAARLLTPGEGEVEHVSLAPDGRSILYASNQADISRRDLWQVTATGSPKQLTSGPHIEWAPVLTGDGRSVAFLRSDARGPARPALMPAGGGEARDLAPSAIPPAFPAAQLVDPQVVSLDAADGMRIPAQLFLPPGLKAGERRPAIAFFHGGSRRQMLPGWNYGEYYHHAYALNQYLASRGYVVLSVNFRSGIGYGMEFREALNYGAGGASEFNDVLGAGLYLKNRPDVDGTRIGLWGGSYGGFLTAMGLSRASHLFAAGVDVHGVHDWNNGIRNFVPAYDPLKRVEAARLAFESSPMATVDGWRSPALLIHGDDDRNVAFTETGSLVEQLRQHGVEHEVLVFPDEVHGFLLHATWLRAYAATADFFRRKLGR